MKGKTQERAANFNAPEKRTLTFQISCEISVRAQVIAA
jgi:hypothetical protein